MLKSREVEFLMQGLNCKNYSNYNFKGSDHFAT